MTSLNAGTSLDLPVVEKPRAVRALCNVDITEVRSLVDRLSETLWNVEDSRKENRFPCFHHTRHIIFRFIEANRDPRVFYSAPIWTVWQPVLEPLFDQVVAEYRFGSPAYPKVMLACLEAGHAIDRHVDGAGSNLHTHKIHIPIHTSPQVEFESNGEVHQLVSGTAYEVNNIARHAVRNNGTVDRIHLIFEVFDSV